LDGIRCTSTGLSPEQRGEGWRALAAGPAGESIEGTGADAVAALVDLSRRIEELNPRD